MAANLGYFIIKKPRVSPINASSTKPPSTQGILILHNALSISYTNILATSALLYIDGNKLLTIINEDLTNIDNINISLIGKTINDLYNQITNNPNYFCNLLTPTSLDLCLFSGISRQNILTNTYTIVYNKEIDYLVDTDVEGKLGTCTVSYKRDDFNYNGANSRWVLNVGEIYDAQNVPVNISGISDIGDQGVQAVFYPADDTINNDLNKTTTITDLFLTQSLNATSSQIVFQATPILVAGSLEVKLNGDLKTIEQDYTLDYGILPEVIATNHEPYIIPSDKNIFRIRHNSDSFQEFTIPAGTYYIKELAKIINISAINFQVVIYQNTDTKLNYFAVQGTKGTSYHQLRIEDGTINSVLGYLDYSSKIGDGVGLLKFLTKVTDELLTPTSSLNSFILSGTKSITGNPFIGIDTDTFTLLENDIEKIKNKEYLVDSSGLVTLISVVDSESLAGGILTLDSALFPNDYSIYKNYDTLLVKDTDYTISTEAGWITLNTSAFPGDVYSINYKTEELGEINNEVLLGGKAFIIGTSTGPFTFENTNNTLIVEVNGQVESIVLTPNTSIQPITIVNEINNSSINFESYVSLNKIALRTKYAGPKRTIKINNGSANTVLGFTNGQSTTGLGADGGDQSLNVKNTPMLLSGFVAPSAGNTIIIKNNDVLSRYPSGAIIKINSDFYEVKTSYLVTEANLIGTVGEPYSIIAGSNDTFIFTAEGILYTVIFQAELKKTIYSLVNEINAVKQGSAEVFEINGSLKIKLKSKTSIIVGDGSANRTLGFSYNSEDTNDPDTYIVITGKFKNTYVTPALYTTIKPITFNKEIAVKTSQPQNSNSIIFEGDQTTNYILNTLIRFNNNYYYDVKGSSFDGTFTTVGLSAPLEIAIYPDTLTEYTTLPIVSEGEINFNTKFIPITDRDYTLKKNDIILTSTEFQINNSGAIELTQGVAIGDTLIISYIARRFVNSSTTLSSTYTYFDYLQKGSSIQVTYSVENPDDFYIQVQYGTSLMSSFKKELEKRNSQIANSSSSGFPTGEIPVQDNSSSGNDSYPYRLAIIDEKIDLSLRWWSFFDTRLYNFEKERELIDGYIVGALDGRVTTTDIADAINMPPQRLFPKVPDDRPEDEQMSPYPIPVLYGLNQNDDGSPQGPVVNPIIPPIVSNELSNLNLEKSKLTSLLSIPVVTGTLFSTGTLNTSSGETLSLYVETQFGGSLIQTNVIVSLGSHAPQNAAYIVTQINNACAPLSIAPASVSGTAVLLTTKNAVGYSPCIYILSDAPHVGFGTGNSSAIRSRKPLWTSGYTYTTTVPGSISVHLDIISGNNIRNSGIPLHTSQQGFLQGQMDDWVSPFNTSYLLSKVEKDNVTLWLTSTNTCITDSTSFDNLKAVGQQPFTALDSDSVLNNRISYLNSRIVLLNQRLSDITARLAKISIGVTGNILDAEGLYDVRYTWLDVLDNKNNGLYKQRKVEIDNEIRNQKEAARNKDTLSSISTYS